MDTSNTTKKTGKDAKTNEDIDMLIKIPCFICDILDRCGVGQEHSPIECGNFNKWLKQKLEKLD
ncbi:MAG: hypothetical protein ACFFD4_25320 [Candidatus Odinarchaeota archaeon]